MTMMFSLIAMAIVMAMLMALTITVTIATVVHDCDSNDENGGDSSGAILGPSWAILEPSWRHIGLSWGHLGAVLELLRTRRWVQKANNMSYDLWGQLGAILDPS